MADNDVGGVMLMNFEEIAVIHNRPNNVLHIIGAHGILRNDGLELRAESVRVVRRGYVRRIFHVVVGIVAQQFLDLIDGIRIAFTGKMGNTALGGVGHGAAQLFLGNDFTEHRPNDVGTGDEHVAGKLDHDNIVRHRRRIDRPTGAGTHNGRNLRNDARSNGIAIEYLAIP